jgi:transcriptional regulator GlxA family with amidase domain
MHRVAFVVFPNFQVMGFTTISVFEVANLILRDPAYEVTLLSETGGLVRSTAGFGVETAPFDERVFDTVMVGAGNTVEPATPGMLAFVRRAATTAQRIAAPCIGAFVLAEAGLLDGRSATTHWMYARDLQARFPDIKVEQDRIFMVDGPVWTSAGMTASIDLALALVERDHGIEVARSVARKLVVYHRRAGGQSQFSALLELEPKSDRIQKALNYARTNLRSSLSVIELADVASLSPRHFSRAFHAETGQTPAKAVEHLRVEAARLMMEEGRHSMDAIADETGFADRERMRRAFLRTIGQPPQTVRRNARIA